MNGRYPVDAAVIVVEQPRDTVLHQSDRIDSLEKRRGLLHPRDDAQDPDGVERDRVEPSV